MIWFYKFVCTSVRENQMNYQSKITNVAESMTTTLVYPYS